MTIFGGLLQKLSPIRSFLLNIFPDVLCFFGSSYIMFHIEYDLRQDKHLTDTPPHWKHPQKGSERYDLR